ncbi:pectic acid lyase [Blastopirellula marina]|uniref:Pectic acid lyase n=1 Tax=Blastopirellula marina TaxID=124 RepID=A0A2S8F7M9_9BACT|nr:MULTISPECIES: pectate lyase [Pirellulaceae]PQO27934.1 pectic acid lyase [Blastopirellula marina]RCS48359.1 pectic acid lyase [Bremerella cremea]
MRCIHLGLAALLSICLSYSPLSAADNDPPAAEVLAAMKKAATYFHDEVAVHGGYVYFYSPDLTQRFGEGTASADQIWVQPPGTPTVGMAYLEAYRATTDDYYLKVATETAEALIYGQLESGGWTNCIDFNPKGERTAQYRNGKGRGRNNSSLDDDQTQSAIRFLVQLDKTYEFKNETIHSAASTALDALLAAQYANGAFPQVWTGPVDQALPIQQASFPKYDWKTEGRVKNYWDMYTLNDGLAGSVAAVLIESHETYGDDRYLASLKKLGDFLILAQLPSPQPGWAQQYSYDMNPIWARRFEPAAVAGRESQDAIETLLAIFNVTRDKKYLEPIPKAVNYLEASILPDGQLARYYEMQTNRPLYMNRNGKDYFLTYDDKDLPDHYGWKTDQKLERLKNEYRKLANSPKAVITNRKVSADQVKPILASLDDQGRWITTFSDEKLVGDQRFRPGDQYISSQTFAKNIETLSGYLKTSH